jgi:hypothetical protein
VQRQIWIFLEEADEEEVIRVLDGGAGLRRLSGRFFRGSPEDLREKPETLETAHLRSNEHWVHLIHPEFSQALVTQPVTEGPFTGWSRLDEIRSEVITLVRPLKDAQGLAPGQVRANTHAWFGGEKLRKSPAFAQWVAESLRRVEGYPETVFDWIRVAPGAAAWAATGGKLHYLFREVSLEKQPQLTPTYRPHASIKD